MAKISPQLEWCIVRLGEDMNWWVDEISDEIHWDVDGLSILDPRQVAHLIELLEPLHDYGFDSDIFETAFYVFKIEKDLGKGRVRLTRSGESLLDSDEMLFALPDILDEETGPYADFLDHITKLRVKMLNNLINFEENLTIEELEEEIREAQGEDFIEGRAVHFFTEITSILEYVPKGFEDELDADEESEGEDIEEEFPDLEEDTESIEGDDSLRWDEEDEEEGDEEEEDADGGKDR